MKKQLAKHLTKRNAAIVAVIALVAIFLVVIAGLPPKAEIPAQTGISAVISSPNSSAALNNSAPVQNASNGDSMKKTAQKGDKVAVNYEGRTEDGVLFDTSIKEVAQAEGLPLRASYAPLEFTVGAGQMIKGFDAAVVGMAVGDIKTVKILPADAYGQPDPSMVLTINTSQITQQVNQSVKVGMTLYTPNGASGKIISTDANITKVDFNSPLAGKTLTFKITMVKIG